MYSATEVEALAIVESIRYFAYGWMTLSRDNR